MNSDELLDLKSVAEQLDVSDTTLNKWLRQGKLTVVELTPTTRRITRAELNRFLRSATTPARDATRPVRNLNERV